MHDRAVRLLQVADEHDLQIWKALGRCLLGAANTGIGDSEAGLAQIRDCVDLYLSRPKDAAGVLAAASHVQAEAYARAGRPTDGFGMIEETIAAGLELTLLPEFYLLKGELLLAVRGCDGSAAEPWFQRGFDLAAGVGARMSKLRAAIRLSRLRRDQGGAGELSQPLRTIYETFTEGFETADLREAGEMLASLP